MRFKTSRDFRQALETRIRTISLETEMALELEIKNRSTDLSSDFWWRYWIRISSSSDFG